ncbi:MAG: DJ-1/PfpI family protein [Methanospirillum sp.]|nr:DJ-1/PfpI family protein [Methanospirillum sp.]
MMTEDLSGKKIAVLVESQYIPEEIQVYKERFGSYGAEVHLMSDLWGMKTQRFVSEVEVPDKVPEILEVGIDFKEVNLDEYAAVIMAANYTSVRLRYFQPPVDGSGNPLPVSPDMVRLAPAVRFFSRAMRNPGIIKGALCHGLWLLTPMPELLSGRRVICHEVVLADIANAGAIYTPDPSHVVVDGDLVTGRSYHEAALMVDTIRDLITKNIPPDKAKTPVTASTPEKGKKHILVVISGKGYWGEELIGPLEVFGENGYTFDIVTPDGKRPVALPPSFDPDYVDPALGRPVTSYEVARKVRDLDSLSEGRSDLSRCLDNPVHLNDIMPERPYICHPAYSHVLESYYESRKKAWQNLERYDALLLVGGSGPVIDMVNNQRIHDVILGFYYRNKPIAAECYAIGCLAFAREITNRECIIRGRTVTGHCLEYDYKTQWGWLDYGSGMPMYPQEYLLRDAVGPEGTFIGNFGQSTSTVVDYPFITGRSTSDGYPVGHALVDVLENNLKRLGW